GRGDGILLVASGEWPFSKLLLRRHLMRVKTLRRRQRSRRGATVILAAFLLLFMVLLVAFAIAIGYLMVAKVQLHESADAAAPAAAAELIDDESVNGTQDMTDEIAAARARASQYAAANKVALVAPTVDYNPGNSTSGDVVIGYLANPSNPTETM